MLFNSSKCHILHLGGRNAEYEYTMDGTALEVVEYEKDVGVIVHRSLKPSMQCAKAAARASGILGQLSRGVFYRDRDIFLKLCKVYVYVRPHLEYAVVIWSPWTVGDKRPEGGVQPKGENIRGQVKQVGMTSLEDRRVRGDMITTYRIMTGKDMTGHFFDLAADGLGPRTRGVTGA
jgi:ribonuclease P/MRP protein subunit RPP40